MTDKPFEDYLRRHRRFEPASPDLARRIISAARCSRRRDRITFGRWLKELLAVVLPQYPAFTLTAVLALGMAIGFAFPVASMKNKDIVIHTYFEEEKALL